MNKIAVVLFNLGGPDTPKAIQPFLFNLFFDPAIIALPKPIRWILAKLISTRRAPIAKEIYNKIGGSSPLLNLTKKQADALNHRLKEKRNAKFEVFISMRYWHPMSNETVKNVSKFDPDQIILLPLYPQFSTTTSNSSIKDWHKQANKIGLAKKTKIICCYPTNDNLITAHSDLLKTELNKYDEKPRVLFSAHGLPKKIIAKGDPYQIQIEETSNAIAKRTALKPDEWRVCYQSRVGPLEWIGPSLDEELANASKDQIGVVIVPIAFVSEHSETLVELDIEYKKISEDLNIPHYVRIPALGTHSKFIDCLEQLVEYAEKNENIISPGFGEKKCAVDKQGCICNENLSI